MKVQATLTNLRISPRKTRLVTRALVGTRVDEALLQLRKQTKKASSPLAKLIESAAANAIHNHSFARKDLIVDDIRVGDGMRLKRWLPRAFGRATPLVRRGCNVTVILTSLEVTPAKKEKMEARKKEVAAKSEEEKKTPVKKPSAAKAKEGSKREVKTKKVATKKS